MSVLSQSLSEIEPVAEGRRAAMLVQHPLRPRILSLAREPMSATALAGLLGETRQKVNYHVRQLRRAGFLRPAGRRRRRGLVEQNYVASARAYVIVPEASGAAAPNIAELADATSAARLVALATRMQGELATVVHHAAVQQKRVATLSINADVRFSSTEQRTTFALALQHAIETVVAEHTMPMRGTTGQAGEGRAFRLIVACHPVPASLEHTAESRRA